MDIPWWVSHHSIELPKNPKIKVPEIAIDPLGLSDIVLPNLHWFVLKIVAFIFFDVMNMLAVWIQASAQMRTVTRRLLSVGFDDFLEVFLNQPYSTLLQTLPFSRIHLSLVQLSQYSKLLFSTFFLYYSRKAFYAKLLVCDNYFSQICTV